MKNRECKEIEQAIFLREDNRLSLEKLEYIDSHIKACSRCRKRKAIADKYYGFIENNYNNLDIPDLSINFKNRFWERIDRNRPLLDGLKEKIFVQRRIFTKVLIPVFVLLLFVVFGNILPIRYLQNSRPKPNNTVFVKNIVSNIEEIRLKESMDKKTKEILINFL